ncbi:MAG: MarR family transcriptional regulator [Spartobacteria bacterium]|nr:MarR family transcriptional regulator [Spartobacteria bacterium]
MKTEQEIIDGVFGRISCIRERANLFIEQELQKENIAGILPAHGSILYFLFQQKKPIPMREIVKEIGRVKSTVTGMIHTLEQYGYVEKSQSCHDGRIMLIQLTDKGWALQPIVEKISGKLLNKVYSSMSQEEKRTLASLLAQIEDNLK